LAIEAIFPAPKALVGVARARNATTPRRRKKVALLEEEDIFESVVAQWGVVGVILCRDSRYLLMKEGRRCFFAALVVMWLMDRKEMREEVFVSRSTCDHPRSPTLRAAGLLGHPSAPCDPTPHPSNNATGQSSVVIITTMSAKPYWRGLSFPFSSYIDPAG
jgi:hypothetical protein